MDGCVFVVACFETGEKHRIGNIFRVSRCIVSVALVNMTAFAGAGDGLHSVFI